MKQRKRQPDTGAELKADLLNEADFMSAEVDNLIASAEMRIEQQRRRVRATASDFEASMEAVSELDRLTTALDKLKAYKAQIAEEKAELQY